MAKQRVDALLVSKGLCDSRELAKRLIMAGEVMVGTERVSKPSQKVEEDADLSVKERPKYVGRGGFKAEGALREFGIDPTGWVCADLGASTGGFTDCLLQHGAAKVFAIDVGTNQLVWKLRSDERVVSKERFNARNLTVDDIGERVKLVVMDLSFISLTKVLPAAFSILEEGGSVISLIKPQFELSREEVGKGGIVREPELHQKAVDKIKEFITEELGREWIDLITSPITGTDGKEESPISLEKMLELTVQSETPTGRYDGVDLFLYSPHLDIDADESEIIKLADGIASQNLKVGTVVAPIWKDTGGGSAMGSGEDRKNFISAVRKACRYTEILRKHGVRTYGSIRIDSATSVKEWAESPSQGTRLMAETFKECGRIAADHGEVLVAEGEICWGGMHSWKDMLDLLEETGMPDSVGFQADLAHTYLYMLGYNAPEHRLIGDEASDEEFSRYFPLCALLVT